MIFLFVLSLVIAAAVIQSRTSKRSFDRLSYEMKVSKNTAEIDERLELTTALTNTSKRPIDYVRISEKLPHDAVVYSSNATISDLSGVRLGKTVVASHKLFMKGATKVVFNKKISLPKRGRYMIHGVTVYTGDFIGLNEYGKSYSSYNEIVVLPKPYNAQSVRDLTGGLIGEISVNRFIFEDPILNIGYNDYTGREPMKSIAWNQTAKYNKLLVRNYDHTSEMTVTVLLDVEVESTSLNMRTKEQAETLELSFSVARSVCEMLDKERIRYGFISNMTILGGRRTRLTLNPAFGRNHLLSVLQSLGRAGYDPVESFENTLNHAMRLNEINHSLIIITQSSTPYKRSLYNKIKSRHVIIDVSELVRREGDDL